VLNDLGEIPEPKIRCERCNCTGTVHASSTLGSDKPANVSCPACMGTGFVERTKDAEA
jgi:DnaJ-class molecular chaperone